MSTDNSVFCFLAGDVVAAAFLSLSLFLKVNVLLRGRDFFDSGFGPSSSFLDKEDLLDATASITGFEGKPSAHTMSELKDLLDPDELPRDASRSCS